MTQEQNSDKQRNPDRIIKLKPMEGAKMLNTKGMVDSRLFTGDNNIHAVMSQEDCLWSIKYDSGILPHHLKQRFTSFKHLYNYVEAYFKARGVEISEVKD